MTRAADRVFSWEKGPGAGTRHREFRPRVNISRRIRDLPAAQRRAVFEALKYHEPEIALFVQRCHTTFGQLELELDPRTAETVLAVLHEAEKK